MLIAQLNLSSPPSATTHQFAYEYLHRQPSSGMSEDQKLYREIMDAEPFSGDHWGKGYDEEVRRGWTDSESSSDDGRATDSSVEDEEIVTPSIERLALTCREEARRQVEERVREGERRLESAQVALDTLERAYWRTGGEVLPPMEQDLFGWKELLTRMSDTARFGAKAKKGSHRRVQCRFSFSFDGGWTGDQDHLCSTASTGDPLRIGGTSRGRLRF